MITSTYVVFLFLGLIVSISSFIADRFHDRSAAFILRLIAVLLVAVAGASYNIGG